MKSLKIIHKITSLIHFFNFLPPLLTRLVLGYIFITAGWGKLNHLERTIEFFSSLEIPFAFIQAPFVAVLEFICGLMLLIGFKSKLASLPLMGIMLVAILTAKTEDLTEFQSLFEMPEALYILLLTWLATQKKDPISLEYGFLKNNY